MQLKNSNFIKAKLEYGKRIFKILNLGAMIFMYLESGKPASSLPYFRKVACKREKEILFSYG